MKKLLTPEKKAKFKKYTSFALYAAVIFTLSNRYVPHWQKEQNLKGTSLETKDYEQLGVNGKIMFPPAGETILLFWATWCAPCKWEMERLTSYAKNEPELSIFAVSPFEDEQTVRRFLLKNDYAQKYPFVFIHAPNLNALFEVEATPTLVWLKDNEITGMGIGLNPFRYLF